MSGTITLKVGSKTAPASLKSSIAGHIKSGRIVVMDSIGVPANYVATKGLILARGALAVQGIGLSMVPTFQEQIIDSKVEREVKTGIRWVLSGIP